MNFYDVVKSVIQKLSPTSSQVHVAAPMEDEDIRIAKAAFDDDTMNPPINNLEATMLNAAYGNPFPNSVPDASPGDHQPTTAPKESPLPAKKPAKLKPDGQAPAKDGGPGVAKPGKANLPPAKGKAPLPPTKGKPGDKEHLTKAPEGGRRVATIAVMHKNKILMGKRRDNGKWTTPGGHVEDGEDMLTGAKRELMEETGIGDAEHIEELADVAKVKDREGKPLHVQPFIVKFATRPSTSMLADPDGEIQRWRWIDTTNGLPMEVKSAMHVPLEYNTLMRALNLVPPEVEEQGDSANSQEPIQRDVSKDDGGNDRTVSGGDEMSGLSSLQEIISGMDFELECNGVEDEDQAHEIAQGNLETDPDFYRKKWLELEDANPIGKSTSEGQQSADSGVGLNLDIGSGQTREPGHIGIDTYPYDFGTIVHDVNLGLPFPDESVRKVRMVNALHTMDGLSEDPKPLLSEIQRVLMPDGEFHYEGPNELYNYPENLEEIDKECTVNKSADESEELEWTKQKFKRLANPDAATADDAEPRIGINQYDELPDDALLAMDALNYSFSDATSSGRGNRVFGYPSQGALVQKNGKVGSGSNKGLYLGARVPIFKMNSAKQIVYGVVLSPNESDLQDDMMTAEDIEKTAHGYLEKSRAVGSGHDKEIHAFPVESYIAPQDMEWTDSQYGPQKVSKGAWVLGVKIVDPKEWRKVVNGDYTGFSVGGFGLRDPLV